jgi:undecaprenyl-diphosphatase
MVTISWDVFLTRTVNGFAGETAWIDRVMLTLCEPDTLWLPAILLGSYWMLRWQREALVAAPVMTALIGLLDFIGAQIKHVVARPRPCLSIADLHQLQACGKHFSFPSNHAINTATAAAFLQILYPRSGWVSWPIVGLVGLARVYIGAHYVTDVIGGWIIGGFCGAIIAWLLLQWPQFRQKVHLPLIRVRPKLTVLASDVNDGRKG